MANYAVIQSGFYDSIDGDRRYSAEDFGSMMDCTMPYDAYNDVCGGIISGIGDEFEVVQVSSQHLVGVKSGKAWLYGIWMYNPSIVYLDVGLNNTSAARTDIVVIEVNKQSAVRKATLKVLENTTVAAVRSNNTSSSSVFQFPIASLSVSVSNYITVSRLTYAETPVIENNDKVTYLRSGSNMNNVSAPGIYFGPAAQSYTNMPTINGADMADKSTMITIEVSEYPYIDYRKLITQRMTVIPIADAAGYIPSGMFIRHAIKDSGNITWGNWQRYNSQTLIKGVDYFDSLPTDRSNMKVGQVIYVKAGG